MTDEILTRLPSTVVLALAAMAFAVVLGGGLGLVSGLRQNTLVDTLAMAVALFGVSVPVFWLALLHHAVRGPPPVAAGHERPGVEGAGAAAVSLALLSAATLARLVRASLLEVLQLEYSRPRGRRGCPAPS